MDQALPRSETLPDPVTDPARLRHVADNAAAAVGDPEWARVARLARALTGATLAVVTVVTDTEAVVAAAAGWAPGVEPGATDLVEQVPCRLVVRTGLPVAIGDLSRDPRTTDDPTPLRLGLTSYLGVPLLTDDGCCVGTLCVLDARPREWTDEQSAALLDLAQLLGPRLALTAERRRADELLRLHADVVSGSLSGLVVIDDQGRVQDVNPALTRMLGWTPHDLIGRRIGDVLIPEGQRSAHEAGLERVRAGGEDVMVGSSAEVLALAKDGELVPVELSVTRSTSSSGTRYSGSLRDLRPQTRMQAGLDSVLSHATVVVLEVDLNGVVRRTEGHGLLGGADLVGSNLQMVLGPTVTERLLVSPTGDPARFDLDAFGRAWRASAIPMRPAGGEVSGWVVSLMDITDVRTAQAQLEQAYRTDPLTGLLSRVGLEHEVASLVAAAPGRALRVTTLRLHGLGETNESFGHEVGDELLRISAGRVRTLLPVDGGDLLARVDAGQFSLVGYADSSVSQGWAGAAARLVSRPVRVRAVNVVPQVSVGTATCSPDEVGPGGLPGAGATVVAELLRRAEVAVHAARRAGQQVREYARADDVAARRLVLASNLREALSTPPDGRNGLDLGGRLRLAYQTVHSLADGAVVSVEALLRWHDDTLGPLSPVEVVDVAEGAGLAVALGEHVMARALHDTASWWSRGSHVPVMVNLSALQVCEPSLVGSVSGLLARNGLPGRALVVEVTETAVLKDAGLASVVLQQVRDQGARVFLDDFGTGWSTLERMGDLPLDGIKLDRAFVSRIDQPSGLAAIRSAVALTQSLGVPLVVEGVETTEQAHALADTGADQVQGYLYARPVDLVDVLKALERPAQEPAAP